MYYDRIVLYLNFMFKVVEFLIGVVYLNFCLFNVNVNVFFYFLVMVN